MKRRAVNPDLEYAMLLSSEEDGYDKVVEFMKVEVNHFINLKHLIDQCKSEENYETLLPQMIEAASYIRSSKLHYLHKQFRLFDFKARYYLDKFLDYLKNEDDCIL